jgi:hypothetical protein
MALAHADAARSAPQHFLDKNAAMVHVKLAHVPGLHSETRGWDTGSRVEGGQVLCLSGAPPTRCNEDVVDGVDLDFQVTFLFRM